MKKYLIGFILMFCGSYSFAGKYFEHKKTGDLAFKQFVEQNSLDSFFFNVLQFGRFGQYYEYKTPFSLNGEVIKYYNGMFGLSDGVNEYSYGDISALAGDHSLDPFQLFEGLFSPKYYQNMIPGTVFESMVPELKKVRYLQNQAIEQGYNEDGSYFFLGYAWLANEDKSHFQRPPLTVREMIQETVDYGIIDLIYSVLKSPYDNTNGRLILLREQFDNKFLALNNTAKYSILHLIALHCVRNAAVAYADSQFSDFRRTFQMGLIFNAFADHFLQDAFAAGHIPVIRSRFFGMNNKGVHDYYCRNGLSVHNKNGTTWRTYGDDYYDNNNGETFTHAIEACRESINDLWKCFNSADMRSYAAKLAYYKAHIKDDPGIDEPDAPLSLLMQLSRKQIDIASLPDIIDKNTPGCFTGLQFTPIPLSPEDYDKIPMKYSKNGFFVHAGGTGYYKDDVAYTGWTAGLGWGIDITDYKKNNRRNLYRCQRKNRETANWAGLDLFHYSHYQTNDRVPVYTISAGPQFIRLDRWFAGANLGWLRISRCSYFLFRPAIGYELRQLSSSWAPSLKLFYEVCKTQDKVGLSLSIRFYR